MSCKRAVSENVVRKVTKSRARPPRRRRTAATRPRPPPAARGAHHNLYCDMHLLSAPRVCSCPSLFGVQLPTDGRGAAWSSVRLNLVVQVRLRLAYGVLTARFLSCLFLAYSMLTARLLHAYCTLTATLITRLLLAYSVVTFNETR